MEEGTTTWQKFPIRERHNNFEGVFGGERKEHQKDSEWIQNFKRDFDYKEEQEEAEITPAKIKKKSPGPDCVYGFWLKHFKSI